MPEIHFCKNNQSKGVDELIQRIGQEMPEVEVKMEDCLEFCLDCAQHPIAITNGTLLRSESLDGLYHQAREELAGVEEEV